MKDYFELRSLQRIAIRWWWLLILFAVGFGLIGYFVSVQLHRVYEASATVLVGRGTQATELSRDAILVREELAKNYANIVERQPVLHGVVTALELDVDWRELANWVDAFVVEDTHYIEITARAESPSMARKIASETVNQLILLSPVNQQEKLLDEDQPFIAQQVEILQEKIAEERQNLANLEASLSPFMPVDERIKIQEEIYLLEGLISEWLRSYIQMLSYVEGGNSQNYLTLLEEPQSNSKPVQPRILLNTIMSVALGLLIGAGVVVVMEFFNPKFRSGADLDKFAEVNFLGSVEGLDEENLESKLITEHDQLSRMQEDFRLIRTNIDLITSSQSIPNPPARGTKDSKSEDTESDDSSKVFVVCSPGREKGKSLSAAYLGMMIAQTGSETIIVDLNLRDPLQDRFFQTKKSGGISKLLSSETAKLKTQLVETIVDDLQILPTGVSPEKVIDRLHSANVRNLVSALRKEVEVIILDCPPVLEYLDTFVVASEADNIILVLEAGKTRANDMLNAIERLEPTGASITGVILNKPISKKRDWRITRRFRFMKRDEKQVEMPEPVIPVVVEEDAN